MKLISQKLDKYGYRMVENMVAMHSTSLSQPTQIVTLAHSIVKHMQKTEKSGFRRQENNRLYRFFFGYFWSVFGIFRFLKYRSRYRFRFNKISDICSVFG